MQGGGKKWRLENLKGINLHGTGVLWSYTSMFIYFCIWLQHNIAKSKFMSKYKSLFRFTLEKALNKFKFHMIFINNLIKNFVGGAV